MGVGGHIVGLFGQQAFGQCPQLALEGFIGGVAVGGEHAAEYAFYITVEYGFALVEGEGGDGGGGTAADAAQAFELQTAAGKLPAELFDHLAGGFVQIARAAVIAQARPQAEHGFLFGGGQCGNIGEGSDKTRVVVEHGGDLGLLQHDFRQPNAVRVLRLPRQVVSAVLSLPIN